MKRLFSLLLVALPLLNASGSYQVDASNPQFYFGDESDVRVSRYDWVDVCKSAFSGDVLSPGSTLEYWAELKQSHVTVKGWGLSTSSIAEATWNYNQSTNYTCTYDSQYEGVGMVYMYLHLRWFRYGLTFNANGGTSTPSALSDVCYTNSVPLASLSRTGYTFNGWTNAYNTVAITGAADGSALGVDVDGKAITLYAKWTANQYTVTFNANGGSVSPAVKTVTYDSAYGDLPSPTRTGYTFDGWFTAASGGTQVTSSTKVAITAAQTLYAHWTAKTYTVTFNANASGVTVSPSSKTVTYDSTYGDLPSPTRTGYTFGGWWTSSSGGTQVTSSTMVAITAAQTLYAHWTGNFYELSYDNLFCFQSWSEKINALPASRRVSANGTMSFSAASGWVSIGAQSGDAVYSGYSWSSGSASELPAFYTMELSGGVSYTARLRMRASMSVDPDVPAASVYVLFHNSSGERINEAHRSYKGISTSANKPTEATFDFTVPAGATQAQLRLGVHVQDLTVQFFGIKICPTAIYSEVDYDQVRKQYQYSSVSGEDTYGTLFSPTRTGYAFDGWFTQLVAGGTQIETNSTKTAYSQTVWSRWTPKTSAVTLDRQNGTGGSSSVTATYDAAMPSATMPTRTGYTFGGYYDAVNGAGTQYYTDAGASARTWDKDSSAVTLHAKWTPNEYTVTFDANGGSVSSASTNVTYGSTYGALPEPTYEDHTFNGWWTAAVGGTSVTPDTVVTNVGNHVLYAQWDHDPVSVTFIDDRYGTTIDEQDVEYGGTAVAPEPPEHEGYTFTNWCPTVFSPVVSNMTVRAMYRPNTFYVKYDPNGGSGEMPVEAFTYDVATNLLENSFTSNLYDFVGWATNVAADAVVYEDFAAISNNLPNMTNGATNTLYAVWGSLLTDYSLAADCTTLRLECTNEVQKWSIDYNSGSNSASSVYAYDSKGGLTCSAIGAGTLTFWYKCVGSGAVAEFTVYKDGVRVGKGDAFLSMKGTGGEWLVHTYENDDESANLLFEWYFAGKANTTCWIDQVKWVPTRNVAAYEVNGTRLPAIEEKAISDAVLAHWDDILGEGASSITSFVVVGSEVTNAAVTLGLGFSPPVVTHGNVSTQRFDAVPSIVISEIVTTNLPMAEVSATVTYGGDGLKPAWTDGVDGLLRILGAPLLPPEWSEVETAPDLSRYESDGVAVFGPFDTGTNRFFRVKAE